MIKTHAELIDVAKQYTEYNYSLLADRMGTSKQYINKMKKQNWVPEVWWPEIERATGGKVRASQFRRSARKYRHGKVR